MAEIIFVSSFWSMCELAHGFGSVFVVIGGSADAAVGACVSVINGKDLPLIYNHCSYIK